jgi:anti-sigma B factor antagonist
MDVVVVDFDGQIEDFPVLIQTVDGLVADGAKGIVIELGTLPFINSSALGYLVSAQKTLEDAGGGLALAHVTPAILNILEMTELDTLFPAFETIEEAVDYLGETAGNDASTQAEVRRQDWR